MEIKGCDWKLADLFCKLTGLMERDSGLMGILGYWQTLWQ
jgi:hypothetical protein